MKNKYENLKNNLEMETILIYNVVEQHEPFNPLTIIVNNFYSFEEQMAFFNLRLKTYGITLNETEVLEIIENGFIEIEKEYINRNIEFENNIIISLSCGPVSLKL